MTKTAKLIQLPAVTADEQRELTGALMDRAARLQTLIANSEDEGYKQLLRARMQGILQLAHTIGKAES